MPDTKDYAGIRSLKSLLENYRGHVMYSASDKMPLGKHMLSVFKKIVEDIDDIYLIEISKISPRKWQIVNISTEDNSYNVEDDELFLSPANFDLKILTEQVEIYQYNSLFGVRLLSVCRWELEHFPKMFKVYDVSGKEITQNELKEISERSARL